MDWTDFDADNHATLALHLITRHGRATPLLWLTVDKDELKSQRNDFEDLCLTRLKTLLPEGVIVTILADRGFGDVKLFEFLERLGFDYVIRFRGAFHVSAADDETRLAADWVGNFERRRGAQVARRGNHRRPPEGRSGRVRESCGHEGGLASGRQRRLAFRAAPMQMGRGFADGAVGEPRPKSAPPVLLTATTPRAAAYDIHTSRAAA